MDNVVKFAAGFLGGILILVIFDIEVGTTPNYTTYNGPPSTAYWAFDETDGDIPAPGSNLLTNGGFETYTVSPGIPDGWTDAIASCADSQYVRETVDVYEGLNALKITDDASCTEPGVYQEVTFTEGDGYQLLTRMHTGGTGQNAQAGINSLAGANLGRAGINSGQLTYGPVAMGFRASTGQRLHMTFNDPVSTGSTIFMDGASVTRAPRLTEAGGNDAVLAGEGLSQAVGAVGVKGQALDLDGASNSAWALATAANTAPASTTGSYSFVAWVNPDSFPTFGPTKAPRVAEMNTIFRLSTNANNQLVATLPSGFSPSLITSTFTVPTGEWSLVGMAYDTDANSLCVLFNKERQCATSTGSFVITTLAANPMVFGGGLAAQRFWDGRLDEARLWNNHALTPGQIYMIYHEIVPIPAADKRVGLMEGVTALTVAIIALAIFVSITRKEKTE